MRISACCLLVPRPSNRLTGRCDEARIEIVMKLNGGYCGGVPPLPIPNREVKPACADGTAMRESRRPPFFRVVRPSGVNPEGRTCFCRVRWERWEVGECWESCPLNDIEKCFWLHLSYYSQKHVGLKFLIYTRLLLSLQGL